MNAVAIKTAGRQLGALGAIVCCVVLLSCLFTFLGTITCAVLVGMMMGAFKGAKWFSVAVSLVFPAVIFGLVRGAKVELTQHQVILLAALCFGAFWATYLVSAFMFFYEQRERKSPNRSASTPQDRVAPPTVYAPAVEPSGSAVAAAGASCLELLQGNWMFEASGTSTSAFRKVIHIEETKLELKSIDVRGRTTLLATGDVKLQSLGSSQVPVIS